MRVLYKSSKGPCLLHASTKKDTEVSNSLHELLEKLIRLYLMPMKFLANGPGGWRNVDHGMRNADRDLKLLPFVVDPSLEPRVAKSIIDDQES